MRRFFVRPEDVGERELRLQGDEAAHLVRALRLGTGAQIIAFDGLGREYVAMVERFEANRVVCQIMRQREVRRSQTVSIVLGQGLPKVDKFEWVIQKTTELGVAEIVPLLTERVVPQISARHMTTKVARWERLAREACKQCGRSTVPHVYPPMSLEAYFTTFQHLALKLVFWEGEETRRLRTVLDAAAPVASAAIVVGPEGGLTSQEVSRGESHGFVVVGLGEPILRTETASVVAVTLLQYHFGALG
jgi:16S rRNA (uracil1498-N3)-methyltransferase